MDDVRQLITQLSGRRNKDCYYILCCAVEEACQALPAELSMQEVWERLHRRTGRSPMAIAKALSRAAKDIWENGNRGRLLEIYGRHVSQPPAPKELIRRLSEYTLSSVRYQMWKKERTREYGITASTGAQQDCVTTAAFSRDAALVQQIVDVLNRSQIPLETFQELFLEGRLESAGLQAAAKGGAHSL